MVVFSGFVNILMLTGPLFMLQVYDRVLGSRSEETLIALLILVVILYLLMGILDYARGRIAARVGARVQSRLDRRVFAETFHGGRASIRDLEAMQQLLLSPTIFAVFDIPWVPIFILPIFMFHPYLGWLAVTGGGILVALAILNRVFVAYSVREDSQFGVDSAIFAETARIQADTIRGLGMEGAVTSRWQTLRRQALRMQMRSSDMTGLFSATGRSFRLFLQSAILALGAYLVLQNQISAGVMIAASILMGRALAPLEQIVAQWPMIQRALGGWRTIKDNLGDERNQLTVLPRPCPVLVADGVSVALAGSRKASLRQIDFVLNEGQALGVIGPSGSGKTTLARTLTGTLPPVFGALRLDGATLAQYGTDLGLHIGYLPQDVTLFDATVAENIARLVDNPDPTVVQKAARAAGAHEMILRLEHGYDTRIVNGRNGLSGGQKKRIGFARALYGNPVLLVLDEPNAGLDAEGVAALNSAVKDFKQKGNSVIIMTHQPSSIAECEMVLVLKEGQQVAFGQRDEVLRAQLQNHAEVSNILASAERA